jgi:hypothetical protein
MDEDMTDAVYDQGFEEGQRVLEGRIAAEVHRLRVFQAEIFQMVVDAEGFGDEIEIEDIKEALRKVSAG